MSPRHRQPRTIYWLARLLAVLVASALAAGCGGGDPLPAPAPEPAPGMPAIPSPSPTPTPAPPPSPTPTPSPSPPPTPTPSPTPSPTPAPSPTPSPPRLLRLNGVTVQEPFTLRVRRTEDPLGDRYRFEIDALNWEVVFDLDTARLAGASPTEANLTSDFLVPDGGLILRKLVVNSLVLGTTGTASGALDPCAGRSPGNEEEANDNKEGDDGGRDPKNRTGLIFGRLSQLDTVATGSFEVTGTDDRCNRESGTIELSAPVE